ncbi:MAG: hypothetical protein ACOYLO_12645 [Ferruginibacter sp.]
MKKLLIVSILLCLNISLQAQAPEPPKPPTIEERLKHTNEILQKELQLSANQKAAIAASFKTFFTAEDQLRKDDPPSPPDPKIKAAMDKLAKQRDESIKKILTEAQYQIYLETEKKMRPPMPGKNGKGGPAAPRQ